MSTTRTTWPLSGLALFTRSKGARASLGARLRKILLADEERFAVVLPIRRDLPGVTIGLRSSRPRRSMHPIEHLNRPARAGIENFAEQVREDLHYTHMVSPPYASCGTSSLS